MVAQLGDVEAQFEDVVALLVDVVAQFFWMCGLSLGSGGSVWVCVGSVWGVGPQFSGGS